MNAVIDFGLRSAWEQSLEEAGIDPETMTAKEVVALEQLQNNERGYLGELLKFIVLMALLKKPLSAVINRVKTWSFRWWEAHNKALLNLPSNLLLEWVVGSSEHCESCLKLNGYVKNAEEWNASGIIPAQAGAEYLLCHGYKCACTLRVTDKKRTKENFPILP